uniref:Uncharacterized protein n=1 Tax=Globodera pallida TaxID=36090 RepID=A0A183C5D1_GLOPA
MVSKYPANPLLADYVQLKNCILAGHPDLESLEKCIPKGGLNEFQKDKAAIEKCFTFWICMPKDLSEKECNAPLPPIECSNL